MTSPICKVKTKQIWTFEEHYKSIVFSNDSNNRTGNEGKITVIANNLFLFYWLVKQIEQDMNKQLNVFFFWRLTLRCPGIHRKLRRGGGSSPRCRAGWRWLRAPPRKSPCPHCRRYMPEEHRTGTVSAEQEQVYVGKKTLKRGMSALNERLGNWGSWNIPKMATNNRGASNTEEKLPKYLDSFSILQLLIQLSDSSIWLN